MTEPRVTVIIPNRGRAETDALTRALINLAAAGLRTHCSDSDRGSGQKKRLACRVDHRRDLADRLRWRAGLASSVVESRFARLNGSRVSQ
jgi:hypothetical protein